MLCLRCSLREFQSLQRTAVAMVSWSDTATSLLRAKSLQTSAKLLAHATYPTCARSERGLSVRLCLESASVFAACIGTRHRNINRRPSVLWRMHRRLRLPLPERKKPSEATGREPGCRSSPVWRCQGAAVEHCSRSNPRHDLLLDSSTR